MVNITTEKTEVEGLDFSSIGKSTTTRNKSGIPTSAYNRKVLTYSELLGEVAEKVAGINIPELFNATLLNAIGEKNKEVKEFLVKNNNLTKEFSKPESKEVANKNLLGLNKVREHLNSKYNTGVRILNTIQ